MEALKKNLVFIIGLGVIISIGVYWFFVRESPEDIAEGVDVIEQPSQYADVRAEILGTIAILQGVRLDISVLDDPAFRSLREAPRPPEGEPFSVGRRNPFIP